MSGSERNGRPGKGNMFMWEAIGLLLRIPDGSGYRDTGSAMDVRVKDGFAAIGERDNHFSWMVISKKKPAWSRFFLEDIPSRRRFTFD